MKTRVQLSRSANSLSELSAAVDAFETVDELYRLLLIYKERNVRDAVDFRKRPFKDSKGARISSFELKSPPDITIYADNLWIAALIYVVKNYKDLKGNVAELGSDTDTVKNALVGLTENEIANINIGIKLLAERLSDLGDAKTKGLRRKITAAHRWLNSDSISRIMRGD